MLYWIQAKVVIRVFGISGPFEQVVTQMVNARHTQEARTKFENHMRARFAHMNGESFHFEYLTVADTIP
jgi:hypothetical protein